MRVTIKLDSLQAQAKLKRFAGELQQKVRQPLADAFVAEARDLRQDVQRHVAGEMKIVRRNFLRSFSAKALTKDTQRLPALYVGSRIPWIGIHERGGSIGGKLLIPLYGRVGRKRFKAQITALMRGGNAYFIKNSKGHVVLMAENIQEHDRVLSGFKRRYRKAETPGRLKRGADIPIAVLVPRVTLKKRLDIERLVNQRLPAITQRLQEHLRALD